MINVGIRATRLWAIPFCAGLCFTLQMEGSGPPQFSVVAFGANRERIVRALPLAIGATVSAVLAMKLLLAWRINVNWDEFFYLSHVHALARGELDLLMQGSYTHLFRWITALDLQEVDQIVWLRLPMWALLVLCAWLLYRLARRVAAPAAAAFAVLAFAASWPVLKHGASFRVDSMLLPLTLAASLLVTRTDGRTVRNDLAAALCLGVSFALTTKAVLMLPALLAMLLAAGANKPLDAVRVRLAIRRIALILAGAGLASALLIAAHSTQVVASAEPAGAFAARSIAATLVEVPWLPRGDYFRSLVLEDLPFWVAMFAGLVIAVRRRAFVAAASVLALLPILFYRNAFPYFYPVMMAPAAILVAVTADWLLDHRSFAARRDAGLLALLVLGLLLVHQAWVGVRTLRFDEQLQQRRVVAAVHQIFPAPVPYIDHSGMIASFPKANFLMSSWGVEAYRRRGRDFMPGLLESRSPPPLLLVNHGVLVPRTILYRQLRETDRRLLASSYVDYWGPIKVAGIEFALPAEGEIALHVPFAGRYRLDSSSPLLLNGQLLEPGGTIEVARTEEALTAKASAKDPPITARLVWADAHRPPGGQPPEMPLYSPL